MGWRETNENINRWAGEHPIRYALSFAVFLAVLQLTVNALFDRPTHWPIFLLWVVVFPAVVAGIARSTYRSQQQRAGEVEHPTK